MPIQAPKPQEKITDAGSIMVADDSPTSLMLLERGLVRLGYNVITAQNGQEALELAETNAVDLFLLDVQMPGMTGFETAQAIHKVEKYRDAPVLFLTGDGDIQQRIKGFEAGGVDYIIKPFHTVEVAKRVGIHLELFKRRRESERYANEMETLAKERAKQLAHADRLAMLGTLAGGVAHEINNPLSFISGNVQELRKNWPQIDQLLSEQIEARPDEAEELTYLQEDMTEILDGIHNGITRIAKIVSGLKTFVREKGADWAPFPVKLSFDGAMMLCRGAVREINVESDFPDDLPPVRGDSQQLEQVLVNLCVNASHAMEGRPDQKLWVRSWSEDGHVLITVTDNGNGIPEENLESIWNPFFTTKDVGKGTGLGLSICQNIIQDHGGSIEASNVDEGGARFTIRLPIAPEE
ncbi:sensor histidine kinase [Haliangium ochraceum]|uniref:histidine kinase n=1 Tax=Haliangium ochraceum (strain DSM 14365 / JCM 11303 / SMP-2) TaxID=502025 RepID=D0LWI1_HALO1|nr:ATP-binding protein [Haliangium ochraceum]ACY17631.1 response regulator receiver sensor signal transduction histidine kinase [Haliangium ochraceum DSM 14365]